MKETTRICHGPSPVELNSSPGESSQASEVRFQTAGAARFDADKYLRNMATAHVVFVFMCVCVCVCGGGGGGVGGGGEEIDWRVSVEFGCFCRFLLAME